MAADTRATVEITASTRDLDARLRDALNKFVSFASNVDKTAKKHKGGGGAIGSFLGNVGANIATRGLDELRDAGAEVIDYERGMTRLGIAAKMTAVQMLPFRRAVQGASDATGMDRGEILAAAQAYTDLTGNYGDAAANATTFARTAQAAGAQLSDIATAGAALEDNFGINTKSMEDAFSILITQGEAGKITLRDFAGELAALAPNFRQFKGSNGLDGMRELGALFQVSAKAFGTASEGANGLRAITNALSLNAKKFEAAGVKVFDRDGKGRKTFRNLHEIITAIGKSRLASDPTLLTKAFGSTEAKNAYLKLKEQSALYDEIYNKSQGSNAVDDHLTKYLASDAGRLDKAMNRLKLSIADAFTPERIEMFVKAVEALAEKLGPIVDMVGGIADKVMSTYGVGQAIRGALSDNGNPFGGTKYIQAKAGMLELRGKTLAEQMSAQADAMLGNSNPLVDKAEFRRKQLIADHDTWASAASDIVDAQSGDRTTAESIRRAMVHYYKGQAGGYMGNSAEMSAGSLYLQQAKVGLPDQIATQAGLKVQIALITEAIKAGFAGAQTTVNVGHDKIAKASNEGRSRSHP